MATPFESAQLILTLYEQRREDLMRKARNFWMTFNPKTVEEFVAGIMGPDSGSIRMVLGYWEMAASLVENGAIDRKMFQDSTGEYLVVFAKIEPLIPAMREQIDPQFALHLESLVMSLPEARSRIDRVRERMRAMQASRAAAVSSTYA
jgi:hypothetical protein